MKIFIESTAGDRFECELEADTPVGTIAADFFEDMGWPELDGMGRGQRAVVELVLPPGPSGNKKNRRLKSELTLAQAEVSNESVLRIFPESIAGDPRLRNEALIKGLREIESLCENDDYLDFEATDPYRPESYKILLYHESFTEIPPPGERPKISDEHAIEIVLPADYPLVPPLVRWLTPIFHPNIRQSDRAVCLGQLQDKYVPSMGLDRLVSMLVEIAQWRNFDIFSAFDKDAARWAADTNNWNYITEIGGSPFQIPRRTLIDPKSWGGLAPRNSYFFGQPQPLQYRMEWEAEQSRPKIKFQPTK